MLVSKILIGIPDEYKMSSFTNMPSPIKNLIDEYNKISLNKGLGELINGETTGLELKQHIRNLDPAFALPLLDAYHKAVTSYDDPVTFDDDPDTKELRNIKSFSIKTVLVMFAVLVVVITVSYLSTSTEPDKETKALNTVTVGTKDVLNAIFGTDKKPDDKKPKDK